MGECESQRSKVEDMDGRTVNKHTSGVREVSLARQQPPEPTATATTKTEGVKRGSPTRKRHR